MGYEGTRSRRTNPPFLLLFQLLLLLQGSDPVSQAFVHGSRIYGGFISLPVLPLGRVSVTILSRGSLGTLRGMGLTVVA